MEWIYVKDRLPPDMVPVIAELKDKFAHGLKIYNATYSESLGTWVMKDQSGSGEYVPYQNAKYIYRWSY